MSEHLLVYHGPINVGIVRQGKRALLIDCGDQSLEKVLDTLGVTGVEQVLMTHHHRDQACGGYRWAEGGAKIRVPAAERDWFDNVSSYWDDPKHRWHFYSFHPQHLMLAEPLRVDGVLSDGDRVDWGPAKITVLATPGHTDGSVSYLVEVDGKRVVFSGDVIYDEGQIWDLYSLQKGCKPKGMHAVSDYHGFLGARPQLVDSLRRIVHARPDVLVPSHGRLMRDPPKAVDSLIRRLDICYDKYVAISALRHYFPKYFVEFADRKDHMEIGPGTAPPECLRHFGTTWMIRSKTGAAFVMDCGGPAAIKKVKELVDGGEVRSVDALWITHYHNDHVNSAPEFRRTFACQVITDEAVAQVISNPLAWRLPCISPDTTKVDRVTRHGETWQWHEFKMTAYNFPGQTLYHAGLLVEGEGLRMFFCGDSFTPAGIDDYCAQNRDWLGPGVGFGRCIELLEKLDPTHIFNPHVQQAFRFTSQQYRFMRDNLAEREGLFGELFPWDHANYGMDAWWVRAFPYEQKARPGDQVELQVFVTNHATKPTATACRAVLPRAWKQDTTDWTRADLPPKSETPIRLTFSVPPEAKPGRHVIPLDVHHGRWTLPQLSEAILVIEE